jgi:hypothetical protein
MRNKSSINGSRRTAIRLRIPGLSYTLRAENWNPTRLMEVVRSADTSTGAAEVTTDAGPIPSEPALAGLAAVCHQL